MLTAEERAQEIDIGGACVCKITPGYVCLTHTEIAAKFHAHAKAARAEEREACARLAGIHGNWVDNAPDDEQGIRACEDQYIGAECCGPTIAAAIRAWRTL